MSDNPSAFPTHDSNEDSDPRERIMQGGMTLRDYFAGQAIMICLKDMSLGPDAWAREAYSIADAMLAARKGDA